MLKTHPLLAKFERSMLLTGDEHGAIEAVPLKIMEIAADQDVVREGERPSRCMMVLDGMLATSKATAEGRRQIAALHIPGDVPDLQSLHLGILDSDVQTLTSSVVAFIEHGAIRHLCAEHPRIAAELWRVTLIDAAVAREWIVNLGQRSALSRLAHLFCEVLFRMDAVGRARGNSCVLVLTQSDLSEATGTSTVHVNRVLQDLRSRGLLSFGTGRLTIHDWQGLCDLAGFRSDYLHLPSAGRM